MISIRKVASFTTAVILAAAVGFGCGGQRSPERIVLVVIDTLRRDHLSIYGADIRTPSIERLAGSGTVVRNAAASFHQTSMSMGALFTGRTPSLESGDPERPLAFIGTNWCGLARFAAAHSNSRCVPESLRTLGEIARDRGYWTAGVVTNRFLFASSGFEQGFDEWVEVGKYKVRARKDLQHAAELRAGPRVNEAVRRVLKNRPSDRVFLYVHYMDVHDWYQRRRTYAEAVEAVDASVGDLADELNQNGLLDGTVLIIVGDHGESLGESHVLPTMPTHIGNPSFEQVLGIPLVVVGAEVDEEGVPIRSEDLYHLVARLVRLPVSSARDLEPGELFLSELRYRTYRMGRWKSFWRRNDGDFRLIDLVADPEEKIDVSAAHPEIATTHRKRVQELSKRLAAANATDRGLSRDEIEALEALGYLEPAERGRAGPRPR